MKANWSASQMAARAAIAGSLLLALGCDRNHLPPAPPPPAAVASISLAFPSPALSMGAVQLLQPDYRDSDGNALIGVTGALWASSNTAIASVDRSGNVAGIALGGPVTITVTKDGHSASAMVSVIPDRINFSPFVTTLATDQTLQLSATPLDYSGRPIASTTGPVTWTSGNPEVATVGATTGLVTPVTPGIVRIFAAAAGQTGMIEIEVGAVSPYDTTWNGVSVNAVNGSINPVQFTLFIGRVTQFQLTYGATACGPGATLTVTPNAPIVDAQFSFRFSGVSQGSTTVLGTFAGPASLNGSHTPMTLGSCTTSGGGLGQATLGGGTSTVTKQ